MYVYKHKEIVKFDILFKNPSRNLNNNWSHLKVEQNTLNLFYALLTTATRFCLTCIFLPDTFSLHNFDI